MKSRMERGQRKACWQVIRTRWRVRYGTTTRRVPREHRFSRDGRRLPFPLNRLMERLMPGRLSCAAPRRNSRCSLRRASPRRFNAHGPKGAPAVGRLEDHKWAGEAEDYPDNEHGSGTCKSPRDNKTDGAQACNDAANQPRLAPEVVNVRGRF